MKKEMKAVYFTVGLLLGLTLIVIGIIRIATASASVISGRSQGEVEDEVSSLIEETKKIREERGDDDSELLEKEIKLSDTEEELAKIKNGFYTKRKRAVWLENIPFFIVGVFAIGVAAVVYQYGEKK